MSSCVKWLTLGQDTPFVEQGFPEIGPALSFNSDLQTLFSSSQDILRTVAGEAFSTITLQHDPEWSDYPELGEALKEAGGAEECMCVIQCPEPALWALGTGNRWKQREQAARLAISLALAASTDVLAGMQEHHPEFVALCEQSSIMTGGGDMDITLTEQEEPLQVAQPSSPPKPRPAKRRQPLASFPRQAQPGQSWEAAGQKGTPAAKRPLPAAPLVPAANGAPADGASKKLPRDVPLWISIPAFEMPSQLDGMPQQALVLCSEGKGRKGGLYSIADRALSSLMGENPSEVEYIDDANWDQFPRVGEALKEIASAEECMTVAICRERDLWAVGVSMKGKERYVACKAALAASLALQLEEMSEEMDLSDLPMMADFVEEARAARV